MLLMNFVKVLIPLIGASTLEIHILFFWQKIVSIAVVD